VPWSRLRNPLSVSATITAIRTAAWFSPDAVITGERTSSALVAGAADHGQAEDMRHPAGAPDPPADPQPRAAERRLAVTDPANPAATY